MLEKLNWFIKHELNESIENQQQEHARWQQTLEAMESAAAGKVVEASEVHEWLKSWGTEKELNAPGPAE